MSHCHIDVLPPLVNSIKDYSDRRLVLSGIALAAVCMNDTGIKSVLAQTTIDMTPPTLY